MKIFPTLLICLVFTGIGLVCGFTANSGHSATPAPTTNPTAGSVPTLAPETLRNMGVRVAPLELTTFVHRFEVPAVIRSVPAASRDVYAPVAGKVRAISPGLGQVVKAGEFLVELVRDPLPRAQLTLTQHLLEPARESLHESMMAYRRAAVSLELLVTERERLERITGDEENPVIPTSQLIQIRYEETKAELELSALHHELERHGLKETQVAKLSQGIFPAIDVGLWKSALEHNGFWTPLAQRVFSALPDNLQTVPWTIATIGEIVASGHATEDLVSWLESSEHACSHFLEIGGLLQRGHSTADLQARLALNAFDDLVTVRAPEEAEDWDAAGLLVKIGQHVEAGQPLIHLENPRRMYLHAEPAGSEIEGVLGALYSGAEMTARSMVEGTAPSLSGVTLSKADYEESGTMVARATVFNEPHTIRAEESGRSFRTWRLGEGQRYLLAVPSAALKDVYVLPTTAITEDGPNKIVFLKNGDLFTPVTVEVLYQDHEFVVLPYTSDIFPGNPVVTHGAFELGLALKASGSAGQDAGHGHSH